MFSRLPENIKKIKMFSVVFLYKMRFLIIIIIMQ